MSQNRNSDPEELDRLADAIAEDILNMSGGEVLDQFREDIGDPAEYANKMRARFEQNLLAAKKRLLADAETGYAASSARKRNGGRSLDIAKARRQLNSIRDDPDAPQHLTLAARKESELTDEDVLALMEDLSALGEQPSADEGDRKP